MYRTVFLEPSFSERAVSFGALASQGSPSEGLAPPYLDSRHADAEPADSPEVVLQPCAVYGTGLAQSKCRWAPRRPGARAGFLVCLKV